MPVIKLLNAIYTSSDVARSRAFYEGVLGLRTKFQDGERWLQLDVNGATLAVSGPGESQAAGIGAGAVTLEVDDLDAEAQRLDALGIARGAPRDMGAHGRSLWVTDPDGNAVILFQRAATPA